MSDIVEMLRLRACSEKEHPDHDHGHSDCYLEREAADEIERLRDEAKRLCGLIFTYVNEKHNDDLWAHEGLSANVTARQSSAVRTSNAYAALVDEYRRFHP